MPITPIVEGNISYDLDEATDEMIITKTKDRSKRYSREYWVAIHDNAQDMIDKIDSLLAQK